MGGKRTAPSSRAFHTSCTCLPAPGKSPCQAPRKSLLGQGMGVTGFSETSRWSPPRSPRPCWPWPPASPALVLPSFLKLPLTALLPGPVPWAQPGPRGDPAAPQEASRAGLGLMLGPSEGTQEITRRGARPATPVCVCVHVCASVCALASAEKAAKASANRPGSGRSGHRSSRG